MFKESIEKLRDDQHYYGDFGQNYLSNSDVLVLDENPALFHKPRPLTKPLLEGAYFHTAALEPRKLGKYTIAEASSRSTKIYKNLIIATGEEMLILRPEVANLEACLASMKGNLYMYDEIYNAQNQFEVPGIKEIEGELWKGKADIETPVKLIDLKTTSDIQKFERSAYWYNYDSQAYIYGEIFGKPLVFFVVDKITLQLGIYTPSSDFLLRGRQKVVEAVATYRKFFKDGGTHDVSNHIIRKTL